jgi:hypothetical protein
MGAIVRHWVGINFARWSSFSSSSLDHSILRMPGSSHSDHRALHCFGVFRARSDDTRAHWFRPYFETEALRISSSMLVQTPPLTTGIVAASPKECVLLDVRLAAAPEFEGLKRKVAGLHVLRKLFISQTVKDASEISQINFLAHAGI